MSTSEFSLGEAVSLIAGNLGVVSEYGSKSTLRLCGSRNPTVKRWNGYPKVPGHIPWRYATS